MQSWHPLPAAVYALVDRTPGSVLLEADVSGASSTESRLFLSPLRILTALDQTSLDHLFEQIEASVQCGEYVAGFFSYECGACFEPTAKGWPAEPDGPLAWFGVYSRCHVFDHATGAFADQFPDELLAPELAVSVGPAPLVNVELCLNPSQYADRIATIQALIEAGDVYQLNFTFPIRIEADGSAADLYAALRARQPVDYGAFLHCEVGRKILSLSPEMFFRIDGQPGTQRIVTRPMKGTAPRGRTTAEDRLMSDWLRNDEKNRSENVMIVDLLRNDLGRLCKYGTVRVDELFAVERYKSLWQMTSTISGELRADVSSRDILRALFPCGSVTGAPKVRAMQLLAELEARPRGVYTGAIGYFSQSKTLFNVAIRTIELTGSRAVMGVGSGIVVDSVAADEYRECTLKAQFLTESSEPFSLIETMLWDGMYPLLEFHLDRLEDSADYFDFACDRATVKSLLLQAAATFENGPLRIRLTLAADGSLQTEHQSLHADTNPSAILRICIADHRTVSTDRFLFHKTTNRAIYAEALKAARQAGYEDALFLNRDGQVTEGAISNIFIEREGYWLTPPIACGVLPGVYRRLMLQTRPDVEERILTLDDLKAADSVYLCNAVRGLRRVVIDWDNQPPIRTSA